MRTLTPCPHADVLASEDEIRKSCEIFHGVPIAATGDDGEEGLMAIGHHEPRRALAALLAYCRDRGMDLSDIGISNPAAPKAALLVERAQRWTVFYRHAGADLTDQDWHEDGWCSCEDYLWWPLDVRQDAPDAIATMFWTTR